MSPSLDIRHFLFSGGELWRISSVERARREAERSQKAIEIMHVWSSVISSRLNGRAAFYSKAAMYTVVAFEAAPRQLSQAA